MTTASPEFSAAFLERFELLRPLGEGGVASVWQARQKDLDRICAVKAFRPTYFDSDEARDRFLDEGRLLARISHPNVVQVFDSGDDGKVLFLVLEYLEGQDLREEIVRAREEDGKGALDPARALEVAAGVADGLAVAHEDGIVHRDLKPENVLIDASGVPKVADFGFAKISKEAFVRSYATREGIILGTPFYVAPEVVRTQETSHKADLYALGIILWECLIGRPPFRADNDTATLLMHTAEPVPLVSKEIPGMPPEVDDLIQWCVQKDPEKRPSGAASLARVLREAAEKVPQWTKETQRRLLVAPRADRTIQHSRVPTGEPRSDISPWPRRLALGGGVLAVLLTLVSLVGGGPVGAPRHVEITPCMGGFHATWKSEQSYRGRVAYRRGEDGTWQEVHEPSDRTEHRLSVGDLESGEYELQIGYPGGEVPLPPLRVRPLKRDHARVVPDETGARLTLEVRTSLPVQVALTAGEKPTREAWSGLSEAHEVPIPIGPDQGWAAPRLYFRDAAGRTDHDLLGTPIRGWKRLGDELTYELERLIREIDLSARARDVERRATALTRSEEREIRRIRAEIEEKAKIRNPNLAQYQAVREALSRLGEPFEAILDGAPTLQVLARSGPQLSRYLESDEVPAPSRLRLNDALLAFLPLDATAEAFGAPGPLKLVELLHRFVPVARTEPAGVFGRMAALRGHVSKGQGVQLFRNSNIQTQMMKLRNLDEMEDSIGGILARKASEHYYGVDLDAAPLKVEAPLVLPEASRGEVKQVHLRGYNMTPWILVRITLRPQGGGQPAAVVVRNSAASFPGLVSNATIEIRHDQVMTASFPAWTLPPGRYVLEVSGEHVPGLNRSLVWSLQDLIVTW